METGLENYASVCDKEAGAALGGKASWGVCRCEDGVGDKGWGLHAFRQHRPQDSTVHRSMEYVIPDSAGGDT